MRTRLSPPAATRACIRYQALLLGGMLAGLGAAHLVDRLHHELDRIHDRRARLHRHRPGHLSQWHPLRAIAGALLFSGAVAFQLLLQSSGVQVSPFLLNTIPYMLTLVVLIAWGGNRRQSAPASLGRVYHGTE